MPEGSVHSSITGIEETRLDGECMWVREFNFNVPVLCLRVMEDKQDEQFSRSPRRSILANSGLDTNNAVLFIYFTERSEAQARKAYNNSELQLAGRNRESQTTWRGGKSSWWLS